MTLTVQKLMTAASILQGSSFATTSIGLVAIKMCVPFDECIDTHKLRYWQGSQSAIKNAIEATRRSINKTHDSTHQTTHLQIEPNDKHYLILQAMEASHVFKKFALLRSKVESSKSCTR